MRSDRGQRAGADPNTFSRRKSKQSPKEAAPTTTEVSAAEVATEVVKDEPAMTTTKLEERVASLEKLLEANQVAVKKEAAPVGAPLAEEAASVSSAAESIEPASEMSAAADALPAPVGAAVDEAADVVEAAVEAPFEEPAAEVVGEPFTEPVAEPATEVVAEPTTEDVSEPAAELASEPLTKPASEPLTEPAIEPIGGAIDAVADVVVEETDVAGAMEEAKSDNEESNVNPNDKDTSEAEAGEAEAGEAEDDEVKKEDRMELLDARLRRIEVAMEKHSDNDGNATIGVASAALRAAEAIAVAAAQQNSRLEIIATDTARSLAEKVEEKFQCIVEDAVESHADKIGSRLHQQFEDRLELARETVLSLSALKGDMKSIGKSLAADAELEKKAALPRHSIFN